MYSRLSILAGALAAGVITLLHMSTARAVPCTVNLTGDHATMPMAGQLRHCVNQAAVDEIIIDVAEVSLVARIPINRSVHISGSTAWVFQEVSFSPGFNELFEISGTGNVVTFEGLVFYGYGDPRAIRVAGSNNTVNLVSCELANFGVDAVTSPRLDATVSVGSSNSLYVTSTAFIDNIMQEAGAIYAQQAQVHVESGSRFEGNTANLGAAIHARGTSSFVDISDSSFTENGAGAPSGGTAASTLDLRGQAAASVVNSIFQSNQGQWAGAIHCSGCDLVLTSTRLIANSNLVRSGGALTARTLADIEIGDCYFEGNRSSVVGGAIRLESFDAVAITDTFFTRNRGDGGGGAISVEGASTDPVQVERCSFERNLMAPGAPGTPHSGGAILVEFAEVNVINSAFHLNGALIGTTNTLGGSISAQGLGTHVLLRHVTATEGTASSGGNLAVLNADVVLESTILAFGRGGGGDCSMAPVPPGFAPVTSISSDNTCSLAGDPPNLSGVDPRLRPFGLYGYRLPGHRAVNPGSPPVNRADAASCPAKDLNNNPRPAGAGCDIGAVESF